MGGAGVELDVVEHGQPSFGVICDASPRPLASRECLDVQFPCTDTGRRVLFSETVDLTVYDPKACLSKGAPFKAARTASRGGVVRSSRRFPRPQLEFKDGSLSNLAPLTSALACQPPHAIPILECKDGSLSNLAPALLTPAHPAFAMPSSGSKRPGGCDDGPGLLKHLFARQAQLIPAFLDSPLADKSPQEILALAQPEPSSDEAKGYALFDPEDDVRSRPAANSWTVHEYAVDATRAVRFLPRAIQFLTKPLSGQRATLGLSPWTCVSKAAASRQFCSLYRVAMRMLWPSCSRKGTMSMVGSLLDSGAETWDFLIRRVFELCKLMRAPRFISGLCCAP